MVTLTTERLILRPLTLDDTDALLAVWGDAETMRYYPSTLNREQMVARIEAQIERYATGTGQLAVLLRDSGELIGGCGPVWHEVEGVQELEVGYHIRRDHWGRGYAPEAARAVLDHARVTLQKDDCISLIRLENYPSRRAAEKNGAVLEKIVHWRDYDHCVYRYLQAGFSGQR
ncbi:MULTISPECIES: GNAT family N-acetyltransferase [Acidobacterium]|uniref:Acetyltransferase, GNAT family n=1 Tax=Acidobacterium capsulatum (strain ATCC 51196 / DSM 11244 / BCRC 80197 / JCM 7670 / NBRC 15755 / NCIMB 13165 / 161) TaxID=240015 RepID=C1F2Q3_ACIC5|nr:MULTISPECIES: GNAT family N-acetyltransferase [Acidobacterium]ACO34322.1 acetyltransferase, GNAT family [Acidobacterium capsulatum ATCC 51196]